LYIVKIETIRTHLEMQILSIYNTVKFKSWTRPEPNWEL